MTHPTTRPPARPSKGSSSGRSRRSSAYSAAVLLPLLADLVCVLAFASGGKSSHEAGDSDLVVLAIVWPYAVAALLAHAALAARGRSARRVVPAGLVVVGTTYVLGMVLRWVSGRGIAPGFLVVAAIFLAVTMLGWRAVAAVVQRRRGSTATD